MIGDILYYSAVVVGVTFVAPVLAFISLALIGTVFTVLGALIEGDKGTKGPGEL